MTEGTTLYCGDNCNHTGPHRYPPTDYSKLDRAVEQTYGVKYVTTVDEAREALHEAVTRALDTLIAAIRAETLADKRATYRRLKGYPPSGMTNDMVLELLDDPDWVDLP